MEQESNQKNALYDFLYLDAGRARRFCAQLYDDGNLQSLTRNQGSGRQKRQSGSIGPSFFQGQTTVERHAEDSVSHQYDATDLLPLLLLEALQAMAVLPNSVEDAQFGKLFLAEGKIKIVDIQSISGLWEPAFELHKNEAIGELKGKAGAKNAVRSLVTEMNRHGSAMLGVLKNLPSSVHVWFRSANTLSWSTVRHENLLVAATDIILKHGTDLPGDWKVLGIVDAYPSDADEADDAGFEVENALLSGMFDMISVLRREMGRPDDAYGITPIAIFRDCGQQPQRSA